MTRRDPRARHTPTSREDHVDQPGAVCTRGARTAWWTPTLRALRLARPFWIQGTVVLDIGAILMLQVAFRGGHGDWWKVLVRQADFEKHWTVIPIRPEINQHADASGACTVTFQHCRYGCHLLRSPTCNLDFYTHPILSTLIPLMLEAIWFMLVTDGNGELGNFLDEQLRQIRTDLRPPFLICTAEVMLTAMVSLFGFNMIHS